VLSCPCLSCLYKHIINFRSHYLFNGTGPYLPYLLARIWISSLGGGSLFYHSLRVCVCCTTSSWLSLSHDMTLRARTRSDQILSISIKHQASTSIKHSLRGKRTNIWNGRAGGAAGFPNDKYFYLVLSCMHLLICLFFGENHYGGCLVSTETTTNVNVNVSTAAASSSSIIFSRSFILIPRDHEPTENLSCNSII